MPELAAPAETEASTEQPVIDFVEHHVAQPKAPGTNLYIRERRRRDAGQLHGQPVLFVHGATVASEIFDVAVSGYSWLQDLAMRGAHAFALDIRGYGRSTRPDWFAEGPAAGEPYARATEAIEDIDRAVSVIREITGRDNVTLIGGSWGSVTTAIYATGLGLGKIDRLILHAPLFCDRNADWLDMIADPAAPERPNPQLGGFRYVTRSDILTRWDKEIPVRPTSLWRPDEIVEAIMTSAFDADPDTAARAEPAFRAPNGTLLDLFEVFNERPLYDPGDIRIPTLLIRGANDPTSTERDAAGLYERLGTDRKWQITVGGGSHFVCAERAAPQVYALAATFLGTDLR